MTDLIAENPIEEGAPKPAPVPESMESGTTSSAESLASSPSAIVPMMNHALEEQTSNE